KFVGMFLNDKSYEELVTAMKNGDRAAAFRAAHTLKGVCGNLSLDKLFNSASELTELLRPESDVIPEGAEALLANVTRDFETTVDAIKKFLEA
ncbi:MAG: Hpt domain-containing protein, partial [Eubacteriales bacterium]|nr:Hpt domain-containing protein [Eubacteriales bacterium]